MAVDTINGFEGDIILEASDLGALSLAEGHSGQNVSEEFTVANKQLLLDGTDLDQGISLQFKRTEDADRLADVNSGELVIDLKNKILLTFDEYGTVSELGGINHLQDALVEVDLNVILGTSFLEVSDFTNGPQGFSKGFLVVFGNQGNLGLITQILFGEGALFASRTLVSDAWTPWKTSLGLPSGNGKYVATQGGWEEFSVSDTLEDASSEVALSTKGAETLDKSYVKKGAPVFSSDVEVGSHKVVSEGTALLQRLREEVIIGDIDLIPVIRTASNVVVETKKGREQVYTTGNKPTASEIGAVSTTGGILTGTLVGPNFIATSDERLKSDKEVITTPLERLDYIQGYTYTMGESRRAGVMAQDVQEVLPEAVFATYDDTLGVDYNAVTALLIASIKELSDRVKELEKK